LPHYCCSWFILNFLSPVRSRNIIHIAPYAFLDKKIQTKIKCVTSAIRCTEREHSDSVCVFFSRSAKEMYDNTLTAPHREKMRNGLRASAVQSALLISRLMRCFRCV